MATIGIAASETGRDRAAPVRWIASAAVIAVVYAAVLAVLILRTPPETPSVPTLPPAVMIDLAPLQPPAPVSAPATPPAKAPVTPAVALPPPPPPTPVQPLRRPPVRPPRVTPAPQAEAAPAPPAPPVRSAPPPAASAPAAPPAPPPSVLAAFEARLMAHLERYKHYPRDAQFHHEQGVVRLRFTMDRAGHVLSAQIAQSSGYRDLDAEVLAMVERAAPLPPFPPQMPETQLELLLPIAFTLR